MHARHPLVDEAVLSAFAAGCVAALLVWLGPPGTDLAAHVYQRALYLEHGFTLWNNYWYAGRYSFITYSLIYYPLAAWVGIKLLAVATVMLSASAFAVVVWREWGPATRWSSRTFAVVWAGTVITAAFPFALGFALALLSIWALKAGQRWVFAGLALLSLAASPLAFLLLVVVLVGIALDRRVAFRRWSAPIALICLAALGELLLWRLFPTGGRYPFHFADVVAGCAFCLLGLALTWRVEQARVLRFFFGVYLVAVLAAYVVPSGLGSNVERLRFAAVPLAVLVLELRGWRPLVATTAALALALSWNVKPLAAGYVKNREDVTAAASTWPAAINYLERHAVPQFRVEAVDTVGHWPAFYLANANIPLARGWFRQDDFPENAVLYSALGPRAYLRWLYSLGVGYVVLSTAPPDYSARAEAKLLRSGRSGLLPVFHTSTLTIYRVPHARPIFTGPGAPAIVRLSDAKMTVAVRRAGTYRIAVHWSPYWRVTRGCLTRGKDDMLRLATNGAGLVRLSFVVSAAGAFDALAGDTRASTSKNCLAAG
ncbi:MAG TPA: hypothetical protein VKO84_08360 [Gaiellaceae bacterium]|nr:hypothetical protein [Gaiellaceae bacterium]